MNKISDTNPELDRALERLANLPTPRPMPRCMMPDGGDCCPEYHELDQENQHLRSIAGAWEVVCKWLDHYEDEEATFSRYRDDVNLDGIMTAAQRRALSALFPRQSRTKPEPETCADCGQKFPLLFPCNQEDCPTPGSR